MIRVLLASYLASQVWIWTAVPGAVVYRLYWHAEPDCYEAWDYVEVAASVICEEPYCDPGKCCYEPGEPEGSRYLTVTAVSGTWNETPDERRQERCP